MAWLQHLAYLSREINLIIHLKILNTSIFALISFAIIITAPHYCYSYLFFIKLVKIINISLF